MIERELEEKDIKTSIIVLFNWVQKNNHSVETKEIFWKEQNRISRDEK